MKRGQVTALPITYIFIAIIAAVILIFGGKVILDFYSLSTEAQTKKELQNFQNDLKRIYFLSKGSSQSLVYSFPTTISEICFAGKPQGGTQPSTEQAQLIRDLKSSNVFLFKLAELIDKEQFTYLIDPKATKKFVQCFSTQNGRLNIILQNEGNFVSLTEV